MCPAHTHPPPQIRSSWFAATCHLKADCHSRSQKKPSLSHKPSKLPKQRRPRAPRHSPFKCRIASRIAGTNIGKHSPIAFGLPGRLTIKVRPRVPAVERDKIAVGTRSKLRIRIASPNPGNSRSITARVASGVMSRADGPVPPVVTTKSTHAPSQSSRSKTSKSFLSSGITRTTHSCSPGISSPRIRSISGPLRSSYTPALARSLNVTRATFMPSSSPKGVPQ